MKRGLTLGVLIAVLCVFLCTLISCGKEKKVETVAKEEVRYNVEVADVGTASITEYHKFGGTIKAKSSVSAMPDASGKVTEVLVSEGKHVSKDEVIGWIDPSRAGQTYKLSPVKAPISGTVTSVAAKVGMQGSPSVAFATVETLDDLEIKFSAIEIYAAQLKEGNIVSVTIDAFPGETFSAKITKISPVVNPANRMTEITVKLDKTDSRLKPGMYVRLSVQLQKKENVVVVPFSALTISQNETYCYVAKDDRAVRTVVETGIKNEGFVEVVSGLSEGDRLIVKGQGFVSDGDLIRILN